MISREAPLSAFDIVYEEVAEFVLFQRKEGQNQSIYLTASGCISYHIHTL